MSRPLIVLAVAVLGLLAFALFQLKYEVQTLDEQLSGIRRQIAVETDAIHVLGAEWSYLNRPDRLQALAERYLDLVPVQPAQISTLQTLPKLDPQSHAVAKLPGTPKAGTAKANVTRVAR